MARLGKIPSLSSWLVVSWVLDAAAISASMSVRTLAAWRAITRAASVGTTLRAERWNRCTPVSRSRADICWETAEAVYPSLLAAAAKDPSLVTSSKVLKCTGLTTSSPYSRYRLPAKKLPTHPCD